MKIKFLAIMLGMFLSLGIVRSAGALELLTNGGFESGLTGWTATANVSAVGSHYSVTPNEGSSMAVLAIGGLHGAVLRQPFVWPGLPGTVSFDYNWQAWDLSGTQWHDKDFGTDNLTVSIDSTQLLYITLNDIFAGGSTINGWDHFSQYFPVLPTSPLTISFNLDNFHGFGYPGVGDPTQLASVYLDAVSVDVVPEPSTMLLLGSGLAGLGFFRRHKKREA